MDEPLLAGQYACKRFFKAGLIKTQTIHMFASKSQLSTGVQN
jgi:hypothetical protein